MPLIRRRATARAKCAQRSKGCGNHTRALIIFFTLASGLAAQTFTVSGTVRDAATREILPGATVRVSSSSNGTIANRKGRYTLNLPRGAAQIITSYMGYVTNHVTVVVDSAASVDILLSPRPYDLGKTTVYAKNAEAIIRQAIAEKRKTMASLHSYQFDAYTKTTLYSDRARGSTTGGAVSIDLRLGADSSHARDSLAVQTVLESYSTGYWREGDGLHEVVKQRRQTANIPQEQNLNAVFVLYNFNDDEQRLGKYVLAGPTAPNALDVYEYELLDVTEMFGRKIYRLRMTPKSDGAALWDGIVSIADSTWNVVEVNVRPNSVVNFPFIDSIHYAQGFMPVDSSYWMPTNIVAEAALSVSMLVFSARIRIEHASVLSNYVINHPIADSVFETRRITVDSSATAFDSTFWRTHEVMPLTPDERAAYVEIDSAVKADTAKPGLISSLLGGFFGIPLLLSQPPFTGFADLYHFDCVEGHALGLGINMPWHTWLPTTSVIGKVSYGFSDKRLKWSVEAIQDIFGRPRGAALAVFGGAYRAIDHQPDANLYTTTDNTLLGLLEKIDYRDYYYASGWEAGTMFRLSGMPLSGRVSYVAEEQTTATKNTDFSVLFPSRIFPANPVITEGMLRMIHVKIDAYNTNALQSTSSALGFRLDAELAGANVLGGAFTYMRQELTTFVHVRTSSFGFFDAYLRTGGVIGTLPIQKRFLTESSAGGFATIGVLRGTTTKEFAGDRIIAVSAQQNLGDELFRVIGRAVGVPYIEYSGMEFMLDAGAAWTDIGDIAIGLGVPQARLPYYEAGFGINRILAVLRCDVTWRVTHRFDHGNVSFTITAAGL